MNIKGCFLHNKDDWSTPKEFYEYLLAQGYSDPCPLHSKEDNLSKIYPKGTKLFINPPYSKIIEWTEFIKNNIHNRILLLIPSRTDTKYFHELLKLQPWIYFIKGRLKFGNSKESAPFPSLLLLFIPGLKLFTTFYGTTLEDIIERRLV